MYIIYAFIHRPYWFAYSEENVWQRHTHLQIRFIPQNTVATEDIKVSLLCRTSFASSIFSAACEVHLPATLDSWIVAFRLHEFPQRLSTDLIHVTLCQYLMLQASQKRPTQQKWQQFFHFWVSKHWLREKPYRKVKGSLRTTFSLT